MNKFIKNLGFNYSFKVVTLILFFCAFLSNSSFAINYYFSTLTGDDSRTSSQAQNQVTPWKSIAKLNSFFESLKPGDAVYFKSGEIFNGSIVVKKSGTATLPIIIGAYGDGDKPIINGLVTLSDWIDIGNGIYQTSCTSCKIDNSLLLINGEVQQLGRFPNNDYLYYESTVGNTAIIDNQLSTTVNWTGAEVVIRKNRWIIDRAKITSQVGNRINYAVGTTDLPIKNFGYFFQNDLKTLDAFGEWYMDPITKKMHTFFGKDQPNNYTIKSTEQNTLLSITSFSNIIIQDLSFIGANTNTIEIKFAQNIVISNCNIDQSGNIGISITATTNLRVSNSTISNSLNMAIDLDSGSGNAMITDNMIKNSGVFAGMAKSGSGTYQGIMSFGANTIIAYNTIENTGYNGIYFGGDESDVRNNLIKNFCLVKDDGGGIYTGDYFVSTGKKITNNIIIDGKGAPKGTDNLALSDAHGIYIDVKSSGVEIVNNTVTQCHSGLKIGNAMNIIANGNTFFDNELQLDIGQRDIAPNYLIRNIKIDNNILFAKSYDQLTSDYHSYANDIRSFGTSDHNFILRPYDDKVTMLSSFSNNGLKTTRFQALSDWQSFWNFDLNSKKSPKTFPYYKINSITGDNLIAEGKFTNNVFTVFSSSEDNNGVVNWDNSGKLDGGSLKVSFSAPSTKSSIVSIGISNVGAVVADKNYLLKFSAFAEVKERNISLYLQQANPPYHKLTKISYLPIQADRTENEVLFIAPITEDNLNLIFEVNDFDKDIWLDNINLSPADASISDPNEEITFVYNAEKTVKTVKLYGTHVDAKNISYSGDIKLAPFSSIVLIRTSTVGSPNITPSAPIIFGDDIKNTLVATHGVFPDNILVSENGEAFVPYTGPINVGNISRPFGFWQFKISAGDLRNESEVVSSPAFTFETVPTVPIPLIENQLSPPNAFSPNGDGINDLWNIKDIDRYPNCIVKIFSREGKQVFHSNGYQTSWDGNYKEMPCKIGVYYYIIDLGNKKYISGSIFLIR